MPGAGIGLALVKALVELHHGNINVVSELSVGSEFSVVLPLANAADANHVDQATMNRSLVLATVDTFSNEQVEDEVEQVDVTAKVDEQKPLVLVIEDNQDMRQYLVSTLSASYQCKTANNDEMGIELAEKIQPDLIISDVMMPKKDGFEVTRTLKHNDATNHIPIILLTAHSDKQSRLQGWQEKADEFLQKPFDAKALIDSTDNLFSIRALLSHRYQKALSNPGISNPAANIKNTLAEPTEMASENAHQLFSEQMNRVLEKHYGNDSFSAKEFAIQMNCSPRNFARKIALLLDSKPSEVLRIFRLRKAAELLNKGTPSSEVTVKVGFNSHPYFSQCFKAQYDCSPSQYPPS